MRLYVLSTFVLRAFASSRTTAPDGALVVGSTGTYSTIQSAVDSLSKSTTSDQSIFIQAGTYGEQVIIPKLKGKLTVYGYTEDTTTYINNTVLVTHSSSLATGAENDQATGTVQNSSPRSAFYNINIQNTYGKGSQAIALAAYGAEQGYYGVQLLGYQDTLLANIGTQAYAGSYIEGAVDFIFGQHAVVWLDSCTIGVVAAKSAITASGRASEDDPSYYVINKSKVQASSNSSATKGSTYLGRPWKDFARVVFQNTELSDIIAPAGWKIWQPNEPNTDHVSFGEFGNTGDGAAGTRANFSQALTAALMIDDILGANYSSWVDTTYLG